MGFYVHIGLKYDYIYTHSYMPLKIVKVKSASITKINMIKVIS